MARPTFEADCKTFVSNLRKLRARVGNGYFRDALGWTESRYTRVKEALVEEGRVLRGRGRGGSIGLPGF